MMVCRKIPPSFREAFSGVDSLRLKYSFTVIVDIPKGIMVSQCARECAIVMPHMPFNA